MFTYPCVARSFYSDFLESSYAHDGEPATRLTSVLISRFLLDLQEANKRALDMDSSSDAGAAPDAGGGSLNFARFVGSIGASIGDDDDEYLSEVGRGWEGRGEPSVEDHPSDDGRGIGGVSVHQEAGGDASAPDVERAECRGDVVEVLCSASF